MTPHEFVAKWKGNVLSERSGAQQHFLDLCALFNHPTPAAVDKLGEDFTFERGLTKSGGGQGFADVWKRGAFAFEYKKYKRNLDDALVQLTRYASALENPPLHVACDTQKFKIVTAWTNLVPATYELTLDDLLDPDKRKILENVFHNPDALRPGVTREKVTRDAADQFTTIANRLNARHADSEAVAHFINQLVFCFFAEDVGLLPVVNDREGYFTRLLKNAQKNPANSKRMLDELFGAMQHGGPHGIEDINQFNGGLFDDRRAFPLDGDDLRILAGLGRLEWDQIDPTIFGTLFERFLDPDKRKQIGAHYTDPDKIMMIVNPVIVRPLTREWEAARARITGLMDGSIKPPKRESGSGSLKPLDAAIGEREAFLKRLRGVSVLDPACGSANFLYLALHAIKDIENRALLECEALGLPPEVPSIGPEILHGIELSPLAAELARTTIWIGFIQWEIKNMVGVGQRPILRKLNTIECRDALVTQRADGTWGEADWPDAEFIIGNPPFLGGKRLRTELGDQSVDTLFDVFDKRVPREADLVTYWFEKARAKIEGGQTTRAGLVSTNSIRGGANRRLLERVIEDAAVFDAWSDEPWIVEGAAVRVSIVCFGRLLGDESLRLNGTQVQTISSDLSSAAVDITQAVQLSENRSIAFMGDTKGGAFDITGDEARDLLRQPLNPNGRPNSDAIRPWINGLDVTRRPRDMWIIDFGWKMTESEAALYEAPFAHVLREVKPVRASNNRESYAQYWWRHVEPRPSMWSALETQLRYIVTPRVATHRTFQFLPKVVCPDSATIAIARDDDTTFGVLHSRFHEAWSLRLGTSLGVGNDPRYTPTTTFETFPFPNGLTPNIPAADYASDPRAIRIADASKALDTARRAWLNPADLVEIVPEIVPTAAPGEAPVKYPDRILPKSEEAAEKLKSRTLTKLYNERPQWLADLHDTLDRAVVAAYGWPEDITTDDALARLLALNLERAAAGR